MGQYAQRQFAAPRAVAARPHALPWSCFIIELTFLGGRERQHASAAHDRLQHGRFDLFTVGSPNLSAGFAEGARQLRADIGYSLQTYLPGYAVGKIDVMGLLMDFSETPGKIWGPPFLPGQHTAEILRELGLEPEALRSAFTSMGAEGSLAQKVDQIRKPVYGLLLVALMLSVVGTATVHSASAEMPVDYLPPVNVVEPTTTGTPRSGEGRYSFLCTGDAAAFAAVGSRFLQLPMGMVNHVQLPLEAAA